MRFSGIKLAIVCTISSVASFAGVTVSSPTTDTVKVANSIHIVASSSSPYAPINAMSINLDSQNVYHIHASQIDQTLTLTPGTHRIYVKAWDNKDHYFDKIFTVTAGDTGGTTTTPGKTTISGIEDMTGWEWCGSCAGKGGVGATVPYSLTQGQVDPSLDGDSAQFWLGGTSATPYANALFFKRLTPAATANNFSLVFDFYIKDATASQGLEMDIFYSRGGHKNYFLTECDSTGKYAGTWQVSNAIIDQWQHTGLPCHIKSYSWNHVELQFYRQPDGNTKFVSVAMNGDMHYVNQTYPAKSVTSFEMNPAIQLDGNSHQTNYSIWVDRMKVNYW